MMESGMTADQRNTFSDGDTGTGDNSWSSAPSDGPIPVDSTSAGCNVLLFVHGGVWSMGEKSQFAQFAFRFAAEGLVVVVAQYSLFPAATVPEQVADVCSALTWTMDHIGEYGGNPNRIFLAGHSSGGCETMCVLVRVCAVLVWAAV